MPYIRQSQRNIIDEDLNHLLFHVHAHTPSGNLNYIISTICKAAATLHADGTSVSSTYERFNSIVGVLECAKLELYRRLIAPYEDQKIQENGDV